MSTSPFANYAEEVAILTEYARPIAARDRPRFYERVSELMKSREIGPGATARACAAAQREFLVAPAIAEPRSPYRRRG
jgi:hypothetical protein